MKTYNIPTTYEAINFYTKFFATNDGRKLWMFLTRPDIVQLMEGAVYLNKTAVEILTPFLLREFEKEVFTNEIKQMIGNMVRKILEANGYQHKKYDIPCKNNEIFSSASKYKKNS